MKKLPLFAKFTVSSLVSAGVDFLFFFLVQKTLENSGHSMTNSIIAATVSARFLSTAVNFLINKFWSFESQQNGTRQVILFTFLFLGKMGASAALVSFLLAFLPVPAVTLKIIVDTLLFFVSFIIQKHFIF